MLRLIIYTLFVIMTVVPAMGQEVKSQAEWRLLLQQSKQDSNRILLLHELAGTYLIQKFKHNKAIYMDTAVEFLDHAIKLSDTLQLKSLRYRSMMFEAKAYLVKGDSVEGTKRFFEVAAIYHTNGDIDGEARTWLEFAINMNRTGEGVNQIEDFFGKAIALYRKSHNKKGEAETRTYLADYLFQSEKISEAEKELLQALDLLHQISNTKVSNIYYLLSVVNRYRGAYEKSLLYATKCVENAERNNDRADVDMFYGELALVYDELGRIEESSHWYRKAIEEKVKRKADRAFVFRTSGLLIRQLIKLKRSRQGLALMDSLVAMGPPQDPYQKAIVMQNFAYCFNALKRYPEAEKYFLSMTEYLRNTPWDLELVAIGNMDVGRFYLQRGQFKKAHIYLDSALSYRSNHLVDERELFHMLFTADSALGNYSAAIKDLQQYQFINDSLYNERKSRQIEELTIQYETQKKEQSIRLLENEKRLQQNELTKEQNTKRWIVGATLLLMVIIGLLVNYSRLKQRTNQELQVQQNQIEKKNNSLQDLVAEKEWLVKEIHHRVKNNFHMVMGLLRTQAAYLQSEEAIQAVTESQQRVQAMSLVHQKLYQSENLSAINMVDYIHELIDYLKDSFHTGHAIRFNLQIDPVKFNVSHSIPVGLILNEAVTNAIKHAFPGKKEDVIDISLKRIGEDRFLLVIKDNGVGLPAAFDLSNQTSMGMKLMRGLSDDLDATFQVNNNNGTQITLDFITEA
jgi:two-component sensor histidine kinase